TDTENEKVRIANSLGIVKGIGDGRFAPDNKITRQEISVMLYRTLRAAKPGYNYSGEYSHIFEDYDMISSWAREAVDYLYGIGVTNGIGGDRFSPGGNTSREQAIVLAKRLCDKVTASNDNLIASRDGTSRQESAVELKLAKLIAQEMGKPYEWGGTGPDSYDCSGLVYYIYGKLGITLPRVARDQAGAGTYVSKEELTYGDLVFFARDGKNIHHVGIYIGNGEFVHSPQTGDVVKKTTLLSGYYSECYYTARRVIN
ncbi:MAG: NlpC/P60 family protein, partial [Clostridiaceae bacterium]|nr:NlpC/P60 family protein [Clostridiaceae bacterium]